MVKTYAPDKWAVLPLRKSTDRRNIRTEADTRALSVRNYLWMNGELATNATSMWNEPVAVFRATKIFDRGYTDHGRKTFQDKKIVKTIKATMRKKVGSDDAIRQWWPINYAVVVQQDGFIMMDDQPYIMPDFHHDMSK